MVRALVLIGASAALGLWLARLLFRRHLSIADSNRFRQGADACLLIAVLLQLAQIRAHGMVLLGGEVPAGLTQALIATTQTHVGTVLWTQCSLLLLAGLLGRLHAGRGLVLALVLVASLVCAALAGHVAADGESSVMSVVAVVHVVLVGLWFGGLPALWLLWKRRPASGVDAPALDLRALRLFSRFALPAMLLILASGLLLATQTVGRWAALLGTPYGWLLLVKLLLVAMVLACAHALRRALADSHGDVAGSTMRSDGARGGRWLAREGALACSVIAAAGTLASWVPAAHDAFDWPLGFRFAPQAAWLQRQEQIRWPLAGAAILVVLGLGVGGGLWRRRRRLALVAGCGAIACGVAVAVPSLTVDAYPSTYYPSEVPYDSASVVGGARLYGALCAQCHGVRGQGDGVLAANLNPRPADLTAPHLGWHMHGDMYWWITHGFKGSAMPAFEGRTTQIERWQLVNYLMALSLGYQARTLSERPAPRAPWLAAINFRYPTAGGGYAQLSELQPNTPALLVLIRDAAERSRLEGLAQQARDLARRGLKVIVVLSPSLPRPDVVPAGIEVVSDIDGEIYAAWSHYRRTLAQPDFRDELPEPTRMELLVDRYGYVRARWRADEGARAPSTDALRAALDTLAAEPEFPLADAHAH